MSNALARQNDDAKKVSTSWHAKTVRIRWHCEVLMDLFALQCYSVACAFLTCKILEAKLSKDHEKTPSNKISGNTVMTNEERRREKLKNAVLYFVQHDKTIGLTKLMKLLYFLDFELYRDYGQSLSGQTYESWDFGPVPRDVWLELYEKKDSQLNLTSFVKIIPVRSDPRDEATGIKLAIKPGARFSDYYFSGRELKKLKEISDIFQGCTAKDIVKIAHKKDDPWDITLHTKGEKQPIDYDLILSGCEEEHKEYIHEVRNDTAAFERILEHA